MLALAGCAGLWAPTVRAEAETSSRPNVRSLAELTQAALRHHPGVQAAAHAIDAAEGKLREARFSPYSQFNAYAAVAMKPNQRGTPIFSNDTQLPWLNSWRPVLATGAEGAVPLYTFGKISAAREAAHAGVKAATFNQQTAMAQLRLDVRRAYYALQFALDAQQLVHEGRNKLQEAVRTLEEHLAEEDADVDAMDRYRLTTALAEVEARASVVQRGELASREALRILTGLHPIEVAECALEPLPFEAKDQRHYQLKAIGDRPEMHALEALVTARKSNVTIHRGKYFPDLAMVIGLDHTYGPGTTDQTNPFIYDPSNYTSFRAALVARWSLDVWGNSGRVRQAKADLQATRAQSQLAKNGVEFEVSVAYQKVADAERREQAWSKGAQEARAWFITAWQGYQIGTLQSKELTDALKAYFSSRFNEMEATHDFNVAIAELERVSGQTVLESRAWEPNCAD